MEYPEANAIEFQQIDRIRDVTDVPENDIFSILVVNCSFRPLLHGRTRGIGEDPWGDWVAIPPVEQNCFGDPQQCIDDGGGTVILSVHADMRPFQLQLIAEPDEVGNAFGAIWTIKPTRQAYGQYLVARM